MIGLTEICLLLITRTHSITMGWSVQFSSISHIRKTFRECQYFTYTFAFLHQVFFIKSGHLWLFKLNNLQQILSLQDLNLPQADSSSSFLADTNIFISNPFVLGWLNLLVGWLNFTVSHFFDGCFLLNACKNFLECHYSNNASVSNATLFKTN